MAQDPTDPYTRTEFWFIFHLIGKQFAGKVMCVCWWQRSSGANGTVLCKRPLCQDIWLIRLVCCSPHRGFCSPLHPNPRGHKQQCFCLLQNHYPSPAPTLRKNQWVKWFSLSFSFLSISLFLLPSFHLLLSLLPSMLFSLTHSLHLSPSPYFSHLPSKSLSRSLPPSFTPTEECHPYMCETVQGELHNFRLWAPT